MILRLHHAQITIPQGAEEKARQFYCHLLGLEEVEKPPAFAGRGGFWLQLGDLQVHVGTEDGVDRNATRAHLAYEVEDLANWRTRFQQQGMAVLEDGLPIIPGFSRFESRDPFSNRIEFIQRLA